MVSLHDFLKFCKEYLRSKGIDSPELSTEAIFAHVLGKTRLEVLLSRQDLSKDQILKIQRLIQRRGKGEPLAYLIGVKEFYGRDFIVNKDVLIPRPCTEILIDMCKSFYSKDNTLFFFDIGTGSGNIAITLTLEFPNFRGIGIDISGPALDIARLNAKRYEVNDRLSFVQTDLLSSIQANTADLIVTNPPYLSPKLLNGASPEVINFEPMNALFGGPCGTELAVNILLLSPYVLRPGGRFLMELDSSQFPEIIELIESQGCWKDIKVAKDYEGHDRIICVEKV